MPHSIEALGETPQDMPKVLNAEGYPLNVRGPQSSGPKDRIGREILPPFGLLVKPIVEPKPNGQKPLPVQK